jgi:hypothetical protein
MCGTGATSPASWLFPVDSRTASWQRLTRYRLPRPLFSIHTRAVSLSTLSGLWFLFSAGLLYLCILDQRYRCRVCLRRLRMPIETGSWGRMFMLGRPRTEYICTYGHGKLNVDELQISGLENPEWTPHEDMWEELVAASRDDEAHR